MDSSEGIITEFKPLIQRNKEPQNSKLDHGDLRDFHRDLATLGESKPFGWPCHGQQLVTSHASSWLFTQQQA